jgi:2,3-bisphosphoglycerate-independent phosphoglycerate mutase
MSNLMSLVFLFLDGLGLAPAGSHNALSETSLPHMQRLLGGSLTQSSVQQQPTLLLRAIDATLGVPGLPQSGTGHVALLAGVNAPELHGRHQPNFPPVALRPLLAEQSLFQRLRAADRQVAFANAFSPGYWQAVANRRLRRSASVIAAEGAGLYLRDLADLRAGQALSWDIINATEPLQAEHPPIPLISAAQAGSNLAGLAYTHDLVFFECFLPDLAGHLRFPPGVAVALERIDQLLGGILANLPIGASLLITSDHGNIEDDTTRVHTTNPVPLLVVGPAASHFTGVERIDQVAEAIVRYLVDQ